MATPPNGFVHRRELDEIAALLRRSSADDGHSVGITTALRGAGGFGKTTLAQALAMDGRVRAAFPDGVLWITMGADLDAGRRLAKLRDLLRARLREEPPAFETTSAAGAYLREALDGQRVLLVVDDVWSAADIEPFRGLAAGSALPLTTRDRRTLPAECERLDVDAMRPDEAVALLTAGLEDAENRVFEDLAGRLGEWPLLLRLVNRQLRYLVRDHGLDTSTAVERIEERITGGLHKLDVERSERREEAVSLTMQVSLDALSTRDRTRYLELAVFPEDTDVPLAVLGRLWALDHAETEELCDRLFDLSLLLRLDLAAGTIRLHDVVREYLLGQNEDLPRLHRTFLGLCSPPGRIWSRLGHDEYLWRYLAYHLAAAGQEDELRGLVFDFDYLRSKLTATDVNALISDYERLPDDSGTRDVQGALRLASHVLTRHPEQLAQQLLGRLTGHGDAGIGRLLAAAAKNSRLHPRFAMLTQPGGPLIRTLEGHVDEVYAVAKIDDDHVVSVGPDGMRVWNVATGELMRTHRDAGAYAMALLDGNRAISGVDTLRLWELDSGEVIRTFQGHLEGTLALTTIGKRVVAAVWDGTLRIWSLETGRTARVLGGHTDKVYDVAVIDSDHVISASEDRTLRVWNLTSGEAVRVLKGHSDDVRAVAVIGPSRAISASSDKTLRIWDLESGETIRILRGHSSAVDAVALLDDDRAVSGSYDETLRVWDLASGQTLRILHGHTHGVQAVTPIDSDRIVSGSDDRTLRIWDLGSDDSPLLHQGHTTQVNAVVEVDENRVISAALDRSLHHWDLATGRMIETLRQPCPLAVAVIGGSKAVAADADAGLRVWDLRSGEWVRTLHGHNDEVLAVATVDDDHVVSASMDQTLRLWDVESGDTVRILQGHKDTISSIATLDANRIVTVSSGHNLRVWDLTSGEILQEYSGGVQEVAIIDERRVVAMSSGNTLRVSDITSGETIRALEGHADAVTGVAVIDLRHVVSVAIDKSLRIWDIDTGDTVDVFMLDATPWCVGYGAKTGLILVGDMSGGVHFLDLADQSYLPKDRGL